MRRTMQAFALIAILCAPAVAQEDAPALGTETPKPLKPAEMRAEQLDILFARLYKSEGRGQATLAEKIRQLWNASDSPTAEVLLSQASRAIDDRAPAEALSILDRLVGAYPDFAEAWNRRATLYFMMKRDDKALEDIAKTLDIEPRHFGALAGRGLIYQRQKKYGLAREAFEDALAINPGLQQVKDAIQQLERLEQGI